MANKYDVNNDLHNEKTNAADAVVRMLIAKLAQELPQEENENFVRKQIWVTLSDGVRLICDVHLPDGEGPWPVILQRCPYGSVALPENDLMGQIFAKRGYVYVTNRCRGTGLSEGHITAFEQEMKDGQEVLDFIAGQDFCNGNVGTYGASYMGHVQWSVAGSKNPALKTMYIQVFGAHPYENFYRNGLLRQEIWQSWVTGNGGNARDRSEEEAMKLYEQAFDVKPPERIGEVLLEDPSEWAVKILTSPEERNDDWQKGFWKEYEEQVKKLDLPILLQCGWFDLFCQSELDTWRMLPEETRRKSLCLIGPWDHYGFTNHVLPYTGEEKYGVMQIKTAIAWFDHFLKGKPLTLKIGGVEAYCIGEDTWKFYPDVLPKGENVKFYLGDHILGTEEQKAGAYSYTYDPAEPVKSLSLGLNRGTLIGPAPGEQKNVFSFVSEPLIEDLALLGRMKLELYLSSTAPATAVTVWLYDVREDGNAYLVYDDGKDIRYEEDHFEAYEPGTVKKVALECQETAWVFKKGNRIRIDISSSDFPWYNAHNNTEVPWGKATESVVAENTIYFGGSQPSTVLFPVADSRE